MTLSGERVRAGLTITEAVAADLPALVALNEPETSPRARSGLRAFHEQKLRAYLTSPHGLLLVARAGPEVVGYIAGVINPDFVTEMRAAPQLARLIWSVLTGRHGWAPRRLWWLARRAYARLYHDPSCRLAPPDAPGPARVGWLNNLIVDPDWRGRGIAGQLLAAAESWLIDRNVGIVGGDLLCRNLPSARMLSKAGYQPRGAPIRRDGEQVQIVTKVLVR